MCFTFCTSQCVYISYVHIDIQVGHIIGIACITGAFPTHIPTYISSGARRILLCNESQYLLGFSQLYKYTSGRLVIVWRQWISSPGAFGWLSNGPDGYGLEVGFPFQHLGRFWWKRWMLDVEIEDNLGIFLSTPFFFFGGFAILY